MLISMVIERWLRMMRLRLEMYSETSGADQIQGMTTTVGGKFDMLSEVEVVHSASPESQWQICSLCQCGF